MGQRSLIILKVRVTAKAKTTQKETLRQYKLWLPNQQKILSCQRKMVRVGRYRPFQFLELQMFQS